MNTITLDSVVRTYLLKQGKNTLHSYVRLISFLIDFLRKFSVTHAHGTKQKMLKLDYKKSAQMPPDLLTISRIGWVSGDRIVGFDVDPTISLYHSKEEDAISGSLNQPYQVIQPWTIAEITATANDDGGDVGTGYNFSGYIRINYQANEIQFSSDVSSDKQIYIEYKTNGLKPKTKSVIPEFASKAAEDYIHWQVARFKLGDSSAETESRRITFWREIDDVQASLMNISFDTLAGNKARAFDINKLP